MPTSGQIGPARPAPPTRLSLPIGSILLVLILVAVQVWQSRLDAYADMQAVFIFGLVPAELFGLRIPPPHLDLVPPVLTLVTAQFLHGGIWHFLGNIAVFLLVAPLAEGRLGFWRFLMVYILAGSVGMVAEAAAGPGSTTPVVGASAAIAGVIGALARRDPMARAWFPVPTRRPGIRWLSVPALPIILVWLVVQVAGVAFGSGDAIAFLAHGVGFVAGVLLTGGRRPRLRVVDRWGGPPAT